MTENGQNSNLNKKYICYIFYISYQSIHMKQKKDFHLQWFTQWIEQNMSNMSLLEKFSGGIVAFCTISAKQSLFGQLTIQ